MKKHTLFKILGIIILAYCVLTWILPSNYFYSGSLQELGRYQIGLFDIVNMPLQTLGYFSSIFVFILVVGGFYAILEETGLYRKALDTLADKLRNKKKLWLIVIMSVIAIISSVAGLEFAMFAFAPFLIALILLLGYDKYVALAATIGATIVGMFGSTYSYTMYGVSNKLLSLSLKDGMIAKVILFILGLVLLVLFTLLYINRHEAKEVKKFKTTKKVEVKEKSKKVKAKVEKVKEEVVALDKFVPSITKELNSKGCKKVWPIYLLFGITLLIFILGTLNWSEAFGIDWFTKAHSAIMGVKIGGFAIFDKLFGGLEAFGTWFGPTKFLYYSGLLLIITGIIALVYKVKFNDLIKSFFEGIKKYLNVAILTMLCYTLLVIVSSYPIFLTLGKEIVGLTTSFNTATTGLFTILGSGLYVDIYYFPQYVLQYLSGIAGNSSVYPILNVLFVSLYSAVMLIVPTSVLLISTLQLTDTSYKNWIKFIWKLFVGLVLVSFIVLTIFAVV